MPLGDDRENEMRLPSEFSFGMPIFENPNMMSGAYSFLDRTGRTLAMGHVQYGLVPCGDTLETAKIVCSTVVFEYLKSLPAPPNPIVKE
jgi:hypothetical protein